MMNTAHHQHPTHEDMWCEYFVHTSWYKHCLAPFPGLGMCSSEHCAQCMLLRPTLYIASVNSFTLKVMNTARHQHPTHEDITQCHVNISYTHCGTNTASHPGSVCLASYKEHWGVQITDFCRSDWAPPIRLQNTTAWTQDNLKAWRTNSPMKKSPGARLVHAVTCNWATIKEPHLAEKKKADLDVKLCDRTHSHLPELALTSTANVS